MKSEQQYMNEAVQLSIDNVDSHQGGPFGCVIVDTKTGKVIGKGANRVVQQHDPTAHAEIVALRDACLHMKSWNLEQCVVYSSCEPCPMCYSALMWARVQHIYYANTRHDANHIGFLDSALYSSLRQDTLPNVTRLLSSNALVAFEKWTEQHTAVEEY